MRKRILIVDDSDELVSEIHDILNMEGHKVSTASNGKMALRLLPKTRVDLIITDLIMPELDGFEFISSVRKNRTWKWVPIIVFSVMPFQKNQAAVIKLGANLYLKKPSTVENLLNAADKYLKNEESNQNRNRG